MVYFLSYKLYTFLVTDGNGIGRPVFYGFVISEKFTSLRRLFQMFKDLMGDPCDVRTFVMDRMPAQIRAARVVFACDINLCYFHTRQAIRRHVSCTIDFNLPAD